MGLTEFRINYNLNSKIVRTRTKFALFPMERGCAIQFTIGQYTTEILKDENGKENILLDMDFQIDKLENRRPDILNFRMDKVG